MNIHLMTKNSYEWTNAFGVCFRGYYYKDGKRYLGNEACRNIASIREYHAFVDFLKRIDGQFCIIAIANEETWLAVDIARSMPVFWNNRTYAISDSADFLMREYGSDVNILNVAELYEFGCVLGGHTCLGNISQLEPGQCCRIQNDHVSVNTYFIHNGSASVIDRSYAKEQLRVVSENAFSSVLEVVNDRPVLLSLSGGYDSRFVACMLKRLGYDNVSCYTYGKPSSPEVVESKKVADALGFRWICVEHSDDRVEAVLDSNGRAFIDSFDTHDYSAYLQNYIAMRELCSTGWLKDDSVALTGLCHDMPTGSYIKSEQDLNGYGFNDGGFVAYLSDELMCRHHWDEAMANHLKQELVFELRERCIDVFDYNSFVGAYDALITGDIHSKRFLHMNRAHEYFGLEWLLPCWDKGLLSFWYSLAPELRIGQNLYVEWLMEDLFAEFGVADQKKIATYASNHVPVSVKRSIGSIATRIMYPLGIPLRRKVDFNNWAPLEVQVYKQIRDKRAVNYGRASLATLLSILLIEDRYGSEIMRAVMSHVKSVK